jgi:hypothetical protein
MMNQQATQQATPVSDAATHTLIASSHARYRKGSAGYAESLQFGRWKKTVWLNEDLDRSPFKPLKKG